MNTTLPRRFEQASVAMVAVVRGVSARYRRTKGQWEVKIRKSFLFVWMKQSR